MTHSASPCSPLKLSGMSPEQAPGHHLQPLLCPFPTVAAHCPLPPWVGGTEEVPAGAISPNRKGEQPGVHVRYKQLLPKGGRERARTGSSCRRTDPDPQACRERSRMPAKPFLCGHRALSLQLRLGKTATLHMAYSLPAPYSSFPTPRMLHMFR